MSRPEFIAHKLAIGVADGEIDLTLKDKFGGVMAAQIPLWMLSAINSKASDAFHRLQRHANESLANYEIGQADGQTAAPAERAYAKHYQFCRVNGVLPLDPVFKEVALSFNLESGEQLRLCMSEADATWMIQVLRDFLVSQGRSQSEALVGNPSLEVSGTPGMVGK